MRKLLSVAVLLAVCGCLADARATGNHIQKASKKDVLRWSDLTRSTGVCEDHPYCYKYSGIDCIQTYVKSNCMKMCGLCGQKKVIHTPAVVYYNKNKQQAKKRVARSPHPTYQPTQTQVLFDHVGHYQHFNFLFPNTPAVWHDYNNRPPFLNENAKDASAQQGAKQEDQKAESTQPKLEGWSTQGDSTGSLKGVKVPASAYEQARQGKDVYIAVMNKNGEKTADQMTAQPQNDHAREEQVKSSDEPKRFGMCGNMPCHIPCPYGNCPEGTPKAPEGDESQTLSDTHAVADAKTKQADAQPTSTETATKPVETPVENKFYPTEVKDLDDPSSLMSKLIAPAPGDKPQKAKYTIHVKPKFVNGVPQPQEIAIMPPDALGIASDKPLVILKQTVTKNMIENIEIDVPRKGTKYTSEPKVEVIEGSNKEILSVSQGQADLNSAEKALEAKAAASEAQEAAAGNTQVVQAVPAQQNQADMIQGPQAAQSEATQQTQATQAEPTQQAQAIQGDASQQAQATQVDASQQAQAAQAYASEQTQATQADATQQTQSYASQQSQASQDYPSQQTQATQPQEQPAAQQYQAPTADQTQAYQDTQTQKPQEAQPTQAAQQDNQTQQPAQGESQNAYNTYASQNDAAPAEPQCGDDTRCSSYNTGMCSEAWLQTNCKKMCGLC
ncbi:mediator of RNA polymerase II transcription subunit 15 isoform X2 [Nematostella vectensis]|uniref:mediator of RNA polymerase II transcription subunit 15 isoform X2 n=1 Tax=Nematostella vectensis TaxID=45351 RepID=UPI002076D9F8|nr:mediator of RNA polymerase II transcription subunit 15 isoform X2 [Nematostella vectensis]